jgi:hypothetical protein
MPRQIVHTTAALASPAYSQAVRGGGLVDPQVSLRAKQDRRHPCRPRNQPRKGSPLS